MNPRLGKKGDGRWATSGHAGEEGNVEANGDVS